MRPQAATGGASHASTSCRTAGTVARAARNSCSCSGPRTGRPDVNGVHIDVATRGARVVLHHELRETGPVSPTEPVGQEDSGLYARRCAGGGQVLAVLDAVLPHVTRSQALKERTIARRSCRLKAAEQIHRCEQQRARAHGQHHLGARGGASQVGEEVLVSQGRESAVAPARYHQAVGSGRVCEGPCQEAHAATHC